MSTTGDLLASASQDETVRIWNLSGFDHCVLAHTLPCSRSASPATGSLPCLVGTVGDRHWSFASGEDAGRIEAYGGWVLGLTACVDGRHLVSASEDGMLAIWDLATQAQVKGRPRNVPLVVSQVANDGHIAVGDLGGGIQLLRIDGLER
jgi:WD domain, G-beta repeat